MLDFFKSKHFLILITSILIFIGGFLFFNSNMLQKKVISANFLSSISPGTSSVLEVKLFNPGEKKSIHLFVKAD
ncbi:MAG: hypothetical protein QW097_02205, partial [archaeon]